MMNTLKILIINFITILLFTNDNLIFSQTSNTCDIYTPEGIKSFFDKNISNQKYSAEYFHLFFSVEDESKMREFGKWARLNGFETEERVTETRLGSSYAKLEYYIMIEKMIQQKKLDYFSTEISSVAKKKKELQIDNCGGVGSGISLIKEIKNNLDKR